jgi:hypothetical protein
LSPGIRRDSPGAFERSIINLLTEELWPGIFKNSTSAITGQGRKSNTSASFEI